jgi:hypothetical protein
LIDDNSIVFGVWQDPTARYGVGLILLKGERVLLADQPFRHVLRDPLHLYRARNGREAARRRAQSAQLKPP